MNLYRQPHIISEIKKGMLRYIGHVEKMPEEKTVKEGHNDTLDGTTSVGKPRKQWLDNTEKDLKKMSAGG